MAQTYATGAGARLKAAFEATPGTLASTGWRQFIAASMGLSPEGTITSKSYLGQGRNAGRGIKGRTPTTGPIVIPMESRNLGFWCRALLGDPTTTTVKATGYIAFSGQPANNSTLTINGTAVTAKTSGATGEQFNIGATIDETITNACTALNASSDAELVKCTYTPNTTLDRIEIQRDLAGDAGNTFTLAVGAGSNATRSAATLLGGGYSHKWLSGADDLPTFSCEAGWPNIASPIFHRFIMCHAGSIDIPMQQEGESEATIESFARQTVRAPLTVDANPTIIPVDMFMEKYNAITIGGEGGAAMSGGKLMMSNNLEPLYLMNGSDLMEEATPGEFSATFEATMRFRGGADTVVDLAEAGTHTEVIYRKGAASTWGLQVRMPKCLIAVPKTPIEGPGGMELTINGVPEPDETLGATAEIILTNDVASYA